MLSKGFMCNVANLYQIHQLLDVVDIHEENLVEKIYIYFFQFSKGNLGNVLCLN
jgi:hypothetical protein